MLLQVLNMAQLQGSMGMAPGPQVVARESSTVQSAAPPQRMFAIEKTFSDPAVRQLAHAVEAADFVAIDRLLAQGANVRAVGEQGMTLTHYALRARTGRPEILRRLLQAGADPVSLLASGDNVPHYAVARDNADPEVVKVLFDFGITPNWFSPADPEHRTSLLMDAIQGHNFPIVKLLVERGARLNHVNPIGGSALHYALGTQFAIAAYLVDAGVDLSLTSHTGSFIKNPKPKTALEWFCATEGGKRGRDPLPGLVDEWKQLVAALARRGVAMPCSL